MVYAGDQWVQLPTRDLYDTQMMAMAISAAKDMYDRGEKKLDDFLNTRVIFGCCKTGDNFEFGKGCIFELNENILEPVTIIKNNKVIAYGEIVIPDENFCVKVTKVVDK